MLIKVHRQPQFICSGDTVADSSQFDTKCGLISIKATLGVRSLVHPSGTTHVHSIVDQTVMNLQGHRNDAGKSRPAWLFVALALVHLDSARVWLSYQAIIWISILARLLQDFANLVTYVCIALIP